MIIWLNGTFGKTVTAKELLPLVSGPALCLELYRPGGR